MSAPPPLDTSLSSQQMVERIPTGHKAPHKDEFRTDHGVIQPAKFTLNFPELDMERNFRAVFFKKRLRLLRVALVCLLAVILGIAASANRIVRKTKDASGNDVTDDDLIHKLWIIQFGVQVPLIVIFFLLSWTNVYHDFSQQIGTALGLCIGGLTIAVSVMGGEPDHGPHMLYFFILYSFISLRFPYAVSACWALFLGFIISVKIVVPENDRFGTSVGYMIIANLALMFATYFTEYWNRLDFSRHQMLRFEEQRTNDLLQTLLPERITIQLKQMDTKESLIAEQFENVTILFSDIVGFTSYSATLHAREVVNFLNTLYTTFDHLTVVHEVLKVETIGDAYFVASGVLEPRKDHAELLANMAFDMGYVLGQFKCKGDFKLQVRIGIHSGHVIAGVVGLKVPRYHLFGDSVTIASLMESTGQPSKVQVSQTAYELLKLRPDLYEFEFREEVNLGGHGKMPTWWLTAAQAGAGHITHMPDQQSHTFAPSHGGHATTTTAASHAAPAAAAAPAAHHAPAAAAAPAAVHHEQAAPVAVIPAEIAAQAPPAEHTAPAAVGAGAGLEMSAVGLSVGVSAGAAVPAFQADALLAAADAQAAAGAGGDEGPSFHD